MIRSFPKPVKQKSKHTKHVNKRKFLEMRLEKLVRQIVFWRDSNTCIEKSIDGIRCNNVLQWGHLTPRKQSRWLKLTIQTFVQCGSHNNLHDKGSQTMALAVVSLLGKDWLAKHEAERNEHRDGKVPIWVLEERIAKYQELWDNRPAIFDVELLKELGYYG